MVVLPVDTNGFAVLFVLLVSIRGGCFLGSGVMPGARDHNELTVQRFKQR